MISLHLHFYSFRGHADSRAHAQCFLHYEIQSLPGMRQLMNLSHSLNTALDNTPLGLNFPFPSTCNFERSPLLGKYFLSVQTVNCLSRFSADLSYSAATDPASVSCKVSPALPALCSSSCQSSFASLHNFIRSSSNLIWILKEPETCFGAAIPSPQVLLFSLCLPGTYFLTSVIVNARIQWGRAGWNPSSSHMKFLIFREWNVGYKPLRHSCLEFTEL